MTLCDTSHSTTAASRFSDQVVGLLACPLCQGSVEFLADEIACTKCHAQYAARPGAPIDLRLDRARDYPITFSVGPDSDTVPDFAPIVAHPNPGFDYASIPLGVEMSRGNRLSPELLSHFPYCPLGGALLDIGCGGEPFRQIAALTNLEYVGIDYDRAPNMLADAHSLPFRDESFECVISFAVLEHLKNPFVALREIARVLKPGAPFIGTVAFLEPFHLHSHFHPSCLGTWSLLRSAGLEVEQIEANSNWSGLLAQTWMGLFPHSPMLFAKLMSMPLDVLHRIWWKVGHLMQRRDATSERARQLVNTGGFRFICRRPR